MDTGYMLCLGDGDRKMATTIEPKEKIEKVPVIPVVCEKCRSKDLVVWRRMYDQAQYIIQCRKCNHAVEFRVLVTWIADIVNFTDMRTQEKPKENQ